AYIGLSVPNFITNKQKFDDTNKVAYQEKMSYYLIAGYVFDLSPNTKFKPALMTKAVSGAPLQADISGNFMFFDKLVLGAAYRWDAAVSGMAGFQITDGLFIGYAYDYDTTDLNNYSKGSHEVFLRYELFSNFNKIISPRFF
ncbi:PorP/SprF family type IX secretion system membrane protein, partial [Flavobacterium noncentrifugens]